MAQPSSNSHARQTWSFAASSRAWTSVSASTITETSRSVKESSHNPMTSPSGMNTPSHGVGKIQAREFGSPSGRKMGAGAPHQSGRPIQQSKARDPFPRAFHHDPKEGRGHHVREVMRVAEGDSAFRFRRARS